MHTWRMSCGFLPHLNFVTDVINPGIKFNIRLSTVAVDCRVLNALDDFLGRLQWCCH